MSKKLEIMQALTALLEGTDGYDLTGRVYRGRKTVSEYDALESMSILEAPRESPADGVGYERESRKLFAWRVNVQGWPREDTLHPSDPAYLMAAAVEERLARISACQPVSSTGNGGDPVYPDDYLLGRRVHSVDVGDSIVVPPTEGLSKFAFFYIPLTISFVR